MLKNGLKFSIYEEIKRFILSEVSISSEYVFEKHKIKATQAPEPLDIIWKNLIHPEKKRLFRRFVTFWITVLMVLLCSLAVYSLVLM